MQIEEIQSSLGREAGVSDWLTVTQELIDSFADLTGDRQWIHVDARTRAPRVALRHDHRARLSHGFAAEQADAGSGRFQ